MFLFISNAKKQKSRMSAPHIASDDAALMERHLGGDDDAFLELFQRLNGRLHMFALRFLGNAEQADDVLQEVWEKVILLRRTPSRVDNPAAYIFMMVRNCCLNSIKYRRRTSPFSTMEEASHPRSSADERTEMEEIVFAALHSLPHEYREVLVLNVYSGYSLGEIAALMDKSPEAIWKRASRAREKLRSAVLAMVEGQRLDMPALGGSIA